MIKWLCIIIGGMGTGFSAYMHFKIQNAVIPITNVEEKEKKPDAENAKDKMSIHEELDPVKLMKKNEINKIQNASSN